MQRLPNSRGGEKKRKREEDIDLQSKVERGKTFGFEYPVPSKRIGDGFGGWLDADRVFGRSGCPVE